MKTSPFVKAWLGKSPFRTFLVTFVVALISFVLFVSMYFGYGLLSSAANIEGRMGADIMVYPKGADHENESLLLKGTPTSFYMDDQLIEEIRQFPGIDQITSHTYVQTLSASCCSVPIQIIGIDYETDFTVKPWMMNKNDGLADGELIIGGDVLGQVGDRLTFYEQDYPIVSRLDYTGLGFDSSIFVNKATAVEMINNAFEITGDSKYQEGKTISSILIKTSRNQNVVDLAIDLNRYFKDENVDVKAIMSEDFVANISRQVNSLMKYLLILLLVVILLSIIILSILATIDFKDKIKEIASIRIMGATKQQITQMILRYSFILSLIGSLSGVAFAVLCTQLFNHYINAQIDIPLMKIPIGMLIGMMVIAVVGSILIVFLTQIQNIRRVNNEEIALVLKGSD